MKTITQAVISAGNNIQFVLVAVKYKFIRPSLFFSCRVCSNQNFHVLYCIFSVLYDNYNATGYWWSK